MDHKPKHRTEIIKHLKEIMSVVVEQHYEF